MTRKEIEELVGQFGELKFNGRFYPSSMHGTIKEIKGDKIVFVRKEGKPMEIMIKGIKSFKQKKFKEK